MTIHVTIGNSDNKLTQAEWADFVQYVGMAIQDSAERVYGIFFSANDSAYQNACWSFEVKREVGVTTLKKMLAKLAASYSQDAIAWNQSETDFVEAEK